MPEIRFNWDYQKTIQAAAYLLSKLGRVEKVKLTKLLYIADRDHFLQHGCPITGDDQYALPKGPVPTRTLDLLDGERIESNDCLAYLREEDFVFSLRQDPGHALLSASEVAILERVAEQHGHKEQWTLVNETHRYPEYRQTYREGTSTRIPYEKILECHETGDGTRFRHGRPVVSEETIANMDCPLPAW